MNILKRLFSRNKKDEIYIVIKQRDGITMKIIPDEINMKMTVANGYIVGDFIAGKKNKEKYEMLDCLKYSEPWY